MLSSVELGSLVTYLAGSALSSEDLKRADAQSALAVFFLSNGIVNEEGAVLDDAANVLRVLSVTNFNSHLKTYAQIITRKDRNVLKNSQVDVVICLDEYRTAIQARNAVCPGISTLIENLFHTFGEFDGGGSSQAASGPSGSVSSAMGWLDEYIAGAEMEVYYVPLSFKYVQKMGYSWSLMAEGVYLEFGAMLIGVCSSRENDLLLHPSRLEINQFPGEFFVTYNTAIVICESYEEGMKISRGLEDDLVINRITSKLTFAEESFKVRTPPPLSRVSRDSSAHGRMSPGGQGTNASSPEGMPGGLSRSLSFVASSSLKKITSKLTTTSSNTSNSTSNSSSNSLKPTALDTNSSPSSKLFRPIQLISRENSTNSKKSSDAGMEDNPSRKSSKPRKPLRRFSKEWSESVGMGVGVIGKASSPIALSSSSKSPSRGDRGGSSPTGGGLGMGAINQALTMVTFANENDAKENFIKTLAAQEATSQQAMEDILAKARVAMAGPFNDSHSKHEKKKQSRLFQGYLVPDEEGGLGASDFMTEAARRKVEADRRKDRNRHSARSEKEKHHGDGQALARLEGIEERRFYDSDEEEDDDPLLHPVAAAKEAKEDINSRKNTGKDKGKTDSHQFHKEGKNEFGHASREIESASGLSRHVIVFGNPHCLDIFVEEMRRSLVASFSYRPIVYVGASPPDSWDKISSAYDDVYWLRGTMTTSVGFNKSNVRGAVSVVLLSDRNKLAKVRVDNQTQAINTPLPFPRPQPRTY